VARRITPPSNPNTRARRRVPKPKVRSLDRAAGFETIYVRVARQLAPGIQIRSTSETTCSHPPRSQAPLFPDRFRPWRTLVTTESGQQVNVACKQCEECERDEWPLKGIKNFIEKKKRDFAQWRAAQKRSERWTPNTDTPICSKCGSFQVEIVRIVPLYEKFEPYPITPEDEDELDRIFPGTKRHDDEVPF
jgi:hypothetical protein